MRGAARYTWLKARMEKGVQIASWDSCSPNRSHNWNEEVRKAGVEVGAETCYEIQDSRLFVCLVRTGCSGTLGAHVLCL